MNNLQALFVSDYMFGLPLPLAAIFVAALGAIIGSFLNVLIFRLPREESVVFPNSRCPQCSTAIRAYDNVPVLSYLILRGRCRTCSAPISARYPAVEALCGILFVLVFLHDAVGRNGPTPALIFDLILVSAILALIFIDAEHMILPNAINYPGVVIALVARILLPFLMGSNAFDDLATLSRVPFLAGWPLWAVSIVGAGLGALAGGGFLWSMGWLWEKLRGVEAMGLGDVKMMFMVGAYVGWRLTLLTIFLGVVTASLTGILLMLKRGQRNMQMLLPFGIFLGAGAIIALLAGARIISWYASQF